jgi:hypothetical protein
MKVSWPQWYIQPWLRIVVIHEMRAADPGGRPAMLVRQPLPVHWSKNLTCR